MTVLIDTTVLLYFLNPATPAPVDLTTGKRVDQCAERVDLLVAELGKARERVLVPAPVLAEVFTNAQAAAPGYLAAIENERAFRIVPFDTLCAIEAAEIRAKVLGRSRYVFAKVPRAKLKYDVLIMATAVVHSASCIYSDDGDLKAMGGLLGVPVVSVADLPLPPQDLFGAVPPR